MTNPFQLSFTLKQHTPIIHFQHDQKGATIRATELKPKLDRFIMEKLLISKGKAPGNGYNEYRRETNEDRSIEVYYDVTRAFLHFAKTEEHSWLGYIQNKDNAKNIALTYKISISGPMLEPIAISTSDRIPLYFGNMGKEYINKPMCLSQCDGNLKILITSTNKKIITEINTYFAEFLFKTNFGTRQNKGYGSFYLIGDDGKNKIPEAAWGASIKLNFDIKDWNDIFFVIGYFYQRLKSGINYGYRDRNSGATFCDYHHSFLKTFITGYEWEKKWVKSTFFPSGSVPTPTNPKFARALLGLYPELKFITNPNPCHPQGLLPPDTIKLEISEPTNTITRIKSPIFFKPIVSGSRATVYVLPISIDYHKALNTDFTFANGSIQHTLKTPSTMIDVASLLSSYKLSLGKSFIANNFNGKISKTVLVS